MKIVPRRRADSRARATRTPDNTSTSDWPGCVARRAEQQRDPRRRRVLLSREAAATRRGHGRLVIVQGRSGRATRRDVPYHTDAAVAAAIAQRCKGEAVLDGAQQRVVVIPVAVVPAAPAISQDSHRDKRPLSFTPIVPSNSLPKARRTTCLRRASCIRRRSRYCSLCG